VTAIEEALDAARATYDRVTPEQLVERVVGGALLVDTRPVEQRDRDGALPGALVIDRNVLEWRLDPTSPDRVPEAAADLEVVLVCNEGYSTSLAAATLVALGLTRATDLAEGFQGLLARDLVGRLAEVTTTPGRRVL